MKRLLLQETTPTHLLDELLVLVELLQVIDSHEFELNQLGTIDIGGIGQDAHGHTRSRNVRQLDGTRETLVSLGVVVLESDLQLDSLGEAAKEQDRKTRSDITSPLQSLPPHLQTHFLCFSSEALSISLMLCRTLDTWIFEAILKELGDGKVD